MREHENRDLACPSQHQEVAPQRISLPDRFDGRNGKPRSEPPVQGSIQRAIAENPDAVRQEDGRGIAPRLVETLVAEPDALPPPEPVFRSAQAGTRYLDAALAAERTEHHGDPCADLRQ